MSLIKQLKEEAKEKYPQIYLANNKLSELFNYRFSRLIFAEIFGVLIILIICVSLYTIYINFQFLQFLNINFEDNIKTFTTIIITLVSMNLFVTNVLFTHLRDERDEIQYIIDNRIHFKFITYLGFTIILCVICLYFISPSFENIYVKSNILILLFISFIYYIFRLIRLYDTVFNFLNKSKRIQIIKDELDSEFSRAFYNDFLKKEFKKRYLDLLTKYSFTKCFSFKTGSDNFKKLSFQEKNDVYLVDIDVFGLESHIKKIKDVDKKYLSLELNQKFEKNNIHCIFTFKDIQKSNLRKYFILKKKPLLNNTTDKENLIKLLNKVSNNTLNNKFQDLNENLKTLENIYIKYVKLESYD